MVLALRKISDCLKTTIQCTDTSDYVLSLQFMHSYFCRWNCLLYNVPLFKNCTQKPHPYNIWAKKGSLFIYLFIYLQSTNPSNVTKNHTI